MSRPKSGGTTVDRNTLATGVEPLLELLRSGESLAVVCHDDPDPDCLSSALGLERIAREEGVDAVHLLYGGTISHRQNWAMIDHLDIDVRRFDPELLDAVDLVAFVDHSVPGRHNPLADDDEPDAVIDHHPIEGASGQFVDNRPSYGATATIITEYLRSLGLPPSERLATALLFGIRRETAEFMRRSTTLAEYTAAQFLHPFADVNDIQQLSETLFTDESLDAIADVIRNRYCRGTCLLSSAGCVPTGEAIPLAADYLLNRQETATTVVYGITDATVRVSARTQDRTVHVGERLERAFADPGSAGGHRNMAGASVPVGGLVTEASDATPERVNAAVDRRLFETFEDLL